MRRDMRLDRVELALPESLEDHPIGGAGSFQEAGDVEAWIGGKQGAHARARHRQIGKVAGVVDLGGFAGRGMDRLVDARVRVGGLQNWLFMACALAQNGVQPEPDEEGNQRENDYNGQSLILKNCVGQHNALNAWIQRALHQPCGIAPLFHGC
jgi:hypothetical protein